ncbi:NarK/NasA family nitrate transporter [uncultured Varibaculum sp.]|uniref:nitrate/nitrite transporter n=1 Tax=uncultured Varibaculum sp. TaxID=413896 RepID=UPI00259403C8|nr:nitrate/nitrite transporter [uncultured Varibaculum sp.]
MEAAKKSKYVLSDWEPNNPDKWNSGLAWRTLAISTYSLILAFTVWFLVSAIAPKLNEIGFDLTKAQLYWLTSMPGLSCGFLRLIYTFLPPIVGTRKLVGWSSILYMIPMLGWFFAVQNPNTPYWWLLALAFMCGIGGGSFSGYMPSTGYFFPKRLSGTALGLQAGIGNLGMSIIQLVGPLLMGFSLFGLTWMTPQQTADGASIWVSNAAIFFVPWCLVAAILSFLLLRDVPIKANIRQQLDIFTNPNTWYMTVLYVMTFGLFSGLSAVFGLLINDNYGAESPLKLAVAGASFAFLGPLIGSVVRMAWGPFCDKMGGAIWTFISGVGMAVTLAIAGFYLNNPRGMSDFYGFLIAMLVMFFFSGLGNAGTFKQMPMIMPARQAGGAIGFTASVASFGPFVVSVTLTMISPAVFFYGCTVFCIIGSALCWRQYARKNAPFPG